MLQSGEWSSQKAKKNNVPFCERKQKADVLNNSLFSGQLLLEPFKS